MKNVSQTFVLGKLLPFVNQHWFKIGVAALALYAFLSKDFAFQINIHSPGEPATAPAPGTQSVQQNRETLTDSGLAQEATATTFDFLPSWGNDDTPMIERIALVDESSIQKFLQRFKHVAETEEEKYGIPATIILANGLLNSQAGKAPYAQQGFNFFRLICSDDWQGQSQDDDRGNCLRSYDNAWMSFRDHSLYYTTGPHAAFRQLPTHNYRAWARAMNDSKLNTEDRLDEQLIAIIERYGLSE